MYSLLIVDDEPVERNGIKHLVSKYQFDLRVYEAENGKKALEFLRSTPVDILFSDIKMPFMDGLELISHAKALNPDLQVIIFSAFGEFDYAQNAIKHGVQNYILKPIDPDEFYEVMSRSIQLCLDEDEEARRVRMLEEGYQKGLEYEKEKLLTQLLHDAAIDEAYLQRLRAAGLDFEGKNTVMLVMETKGKFFDSRHDEFLRAVGQAVGGEFAYLNFNEYQSVLFLRHFDARADKGRLERIGERIERVIRADCDAQACLIFGNTVGSARELSGEYKKLEQALDSRFLFDESAVFFAEDHFPRSAVSPGLIEKIVADVDAALESGDTRYAVRSIEQLFHTFKAEGSLSAIYVKYVCAGIVERTFKRMPKSDSEAFAAALEKIFAENNVGLIKERMLGLLSAIGQGDSASPDAAGKRVIKTVMDIIGSEYMNDIGLEAIAQRVYLTPAYLSYLFKRETGQNLVKFMTSYRLNKAKELLLDTNLRINDICEKVGYAKLSYFCAIFKNHFGVTPAKYREGKGAD